MIELHALTKRYNNQTQIGPVSLQIPEHKLTSLIGPNGAGKSTLLYMLGGLLAPDSGSLSLNDQFLSESSSTQRAQTIATLKQSTVVNQRITVQQLVGFGRFPYSKGRLTKEDYAIINKYLNFFQLTNLKDVYLHDLSGGQQQRVYIAMILAQETPYILLDEPLNNLDIAHSVQIMSYLRQCVDELDRTVVTVLHDLNFAKKYSDHVALIKEGQVSQFGTPCDIMTNTHLSDLYGTPIQVFDTPNGSFIAVS